MSDISRRATLKGAAWSAPVLVIGAQASAATTSRVVEPKLWWNNTYASTQGHQYADNPRSYSFLIGNSLQYGNRDSTVRSTPPKPPPSPVTPLTTPARVVRPTLWVSPLTSLRWPASTGSTRTTS